MDTQIYQLKTTSPDVYESKLNILVQLPKLLYSFVPSVAPIDLNKNKEDGSYDSLTS